MEGIAPPIAAIGRAIADAGIRALDEAPCSELEKAALAMMIAERMTQNALGRLPTNIE